MFYYELFEFMNHFRFFLKERREESMVIFLEHIYTSLEKKINDLTIPLKFNAHI